MKLDKMAFAKLVAFCAANGLSAGDYEIERLDELTEFVVPEAPTLTATNLHTLMALMQEGTRKIEAIKQHRMMTGMGLKESKDIVEKYWVAQKPKEEGATLGDILKTAERPPVNFDKFEG